MQQPADFIERLGAVLGIGQQQAAGFGSLLLAAAGLTARYPADEDAICDIMETADRAKDEGWDRERLLLALTIGILFGIYSSVFVAAAIAMWLGVKREDLVKGGPKEQDPNDPNAGAVV